MNAGRPTRRPSRSFPRNSQLVTPLLITLFAVAEHPAPAAEAADREIHFNIPAEPLPRALIELGEQARVQVILPQNVADGFTSPEIKGTLHIREALGKLLRGSGLSYEQTNNTVTIAPSPQSAIAETKPLRLAQTASAKSDGTNQRLSEGPQAIETESSATSGAEASAQKLAEVTVTGSNIRGVAPVGSPVESFTQEDIKLTGATTTEEFLDRIPQNFNSLRSGAAGAVPSAANNNSNTLGVNSIDLRGLGIGTTLILLNGRPLAPSASGTTPDISLIPLADIARVDILPDGASAIYGSDAVGGVVNFVLKEHFAGAETDANFGLVTQGNHSSGNLQQTFGKDWGSGSALASLGYAEQTPLMAADRDFARPAGNYMLIQPYRRENAYLSGKEALSDRVSFFGDALYSSEQNHNHSIFDSSFTDGDETTHDRKANLFSNLGIDVTLPRSINLEIAGVYARATELEDELFIRPTATNVLIHSVAYRTSSDYDLSAKADGPVVTLPSGQAKFALGAGHTRDGYWYDSYDVQAGAVANSASTSRTIDYAFAELYLPVISAQQDIPLIKEFDVTVAGRYTRYSDFGRNFSPKFSAQWTVMSGLDFRGSYSRSFKAPFLYEVDPTLVSWGLNRLARFGTSVAGAIERQFNLPANATYLGVQGNNPLIGPEKAKALSLGLDYSPTFAPGVTLSGTYYRISYDDKITTADPLQVLRHPELYSAYYTAPPTAALISPFINSEHAIAVPGVQDGNITSILDATSVVIDLRERNMAITKTSGIDGQLSYKNGPFGVGTSGTWILDFTDQLNSNSPVLSFRNMPGTPVGFRDRSWLRYSQYGWNGQLNMNYVAGYTNTYVTSNPRVASWTTFDLNVGYTFSGEPAITKGLQAAVSVQNLFDRSPPYVGVTQGGGTSGIVVPIGYDPTNANALGRFVAIAVVKRW